MNIYKTAVMKDLGFQIPGVAGVVAVTDLWDLSSSKKGLEMLNESYKFLKRKQNENSEQGLLGSSKPENEDDNLRLDILEDIIKTRLEKIQENKEAASRAALRQRVLEEKRRREDNKLVEMTDEELQALLIS